MAAKPPIGGTMAREALRRNGTPRTVPTGMPGALGVRAGAAENAPVLDFMIRSEITGRDENYWDGLRYSRGVAARVGELIAAGAAQRKGRQSLFDYLTPVDFD